MGKLEVVYTLKHLTKTVAVRKEPCRLTSGFGFYIQSLYFGDSMEYNKELARVFSLADANCKKELR